MTLTTIMQTLAHIGMIWLGLALGAGAYMVLGCYTRPWFERRAKQRAEDIRPYPFW